MGKGQNPSFGGQNPTRLSLTLEKHFTLECFFQQAPIDKPAEICHPGEENRFLSKCPNHNATLTEKHNQ